MPIEEIKRGAVRGFIHRPAEPGESGLILTHGASGNSSMPLLVAVAEAFANAGITALRIDLPYRQRRPKGPPYPAEAAVDRAGIVEAIGVLRESVDRIVLGGHSYGGRQMSMVCAEQAGLAAGLLLLSYPLHPPGRPANLRVEHFPRISVPALFVHGTRDGFGSESEMREALRLIPAPADLWIITGGGHGLPAKIAAELPKRLAKVAALS